jgi:hypothetical protein
MWHAYESASLELASSLRQDRNAGVRIPTLLQGRAAEQAKVRPYLI